MVQISLKNRVGKLIFSNKSGDLSNQSLIRRNSSAIVMSSTSIHEHSYLAWTYHLQYCTFLQRKKIEKSDHVIRYTNCTWLKVHTLNCQCGSESPPSVAIEERHAYQPGMVMTWSTTSNWTQVIQIANELCGRSEGY